MEKFLDQFRFDPGLRGAVGVEREYFLVDAKGRPAPDSPSFLALVKDPAWIFELSACQVEHRTVPHLDLGRLHADLRAGQQQGMCIAGALGRGLTALEVGPDDMPLDVYPDARYQKIAGHLPRETLLAACRVTGVHLHFGVGDLAEAIDWHDRLVPHLDELCRLGDHSGGERLRIYKVMAVNWQPPVYRTPERFLEVARAQGFEDNPRNCWHLIRISRHGSVELRMFGMTADVDEIVGWVRRVREILA